jgi:hypothetical protein
MDENAVRAGGGDLERALHLVLAFHIAEVGIGNGLCARSGCIFGQGRFARDVGHHFQQGARRKNARALGKRGLRRVALRQDEGSPGRACGQGHGERASDRTQVAREGKLTRELELAQRLRRELAT